MHLIEVINKETAKEVLLRKCRGSTKTILLIYDRLDKDINEVY
jgi:hypothetical protein